eukprot:403359952
MDSIKNNFLSPGQKNILSANTTSRTTAQHTLFGTPSNRSMQGSAYGLKKKSSLEQMDIAKKEEHIKWVLRELENHQLYASKLIHHQVLSKSDYDTSKREMFIIRDIVSAKKRNLVDKFLELCKGHFEDEVEESNIQIELTCAYTKGDDFDGFRCLRQHSNGQFKEEEDNCLYEVTGQNDKFKNKILVVNFHDAELYMSQLNSQNSNGQINMSLISDMDGVIEIHVLVLSFDQQQKGVEVNIPYRHNHYLIKLELESEIADQYQLQSLPRQLVINSNLIIYFMGLPMQPHNMKNHIDFLLQYDRVLYDEVKNFALVKTNINDYQKVRVLEFLKNIQSTFAENLKFTISWRIDFAERISYSIKGDAKRSFYCEAFFISLEQDNPMIRPIIETLQSLATGWLKLTVNYTKVQTHKLIQPVAQTSEINTDDATEVIKPINPDQTIQLNYQCYHCKKSVQNKTQYFCIQCKETHEAPITFICEECATIKLDYYLEYHNQYQREQMVHHQHCLIINRYLDSHANGEIPFGLEDQEILFKYVSNTLNEMFIEGQRAIQDGDFKEQDVLKADQTCDICESNTKAMRFVCLSCRQLSLCQQCYEVQVDNIQNLDVDEHSGNSILREHKENHLFIRVFDFQDLDIQF